MLEEFDAAELDPEVWNTCQADATLLEIKDVAEGGETKRVLRNTIVESRGNQDTCDEAVAAFEETPRALLDLEGLGEIATETENGSDLGPSLVPRAGGAVECPQGSDFQRNEIRFQPRKDLLHDLRDPHYYSITFRTEGDIPSCGSARWVIAQWKEPDGDSPFLAQRYDNGVLHVTVQNDDCRCVVAKAGGDPDRLLASLFGAGSFLLPSDLREVAPLKCVRSDRPADAPEEACTPRGMTVLTRGGRTPPDLPDPRNGWVEMTYLVKAGSRGNGQVDVYAGNRFVVRVLGRIGYSAAKPGDVKFKLGHYRDRIPGQATLDVDRVCMSRTAATCKAGLPLQD